MCCVFKWVQLSTYAAHLLGGAIIRDKLHVGVHLRGISLQHHVDEQRQEVVGARRGAVAPIEKLCENKRKHTKERNKPLQVL